MLYRVVIGDTQQVRGIVELELWGYQVTDSGHLIVLETADKHIGTWAAGQWRSIVVVEAFNRARKAGVGEDSRGRQAPRQIQAV